MEQQADSTTVPISFAPAAPFHAIAPSSNNHFEDSVDHGDTITIVCALPAPDHTDGPFIAKRKQRTFWTACASCNKKSKHSIESLDCDICCPQCNETFKATEVSRPRNQPTATTENVHSREIVTSPGIMVEPSIMTASVETPLPKRVQRDINATLAPAGKYGGNLQGINAITKNVHSRAIAKSPGTMVEPSKMKASVKTPLPKRVKRDINAAVAAGKYGGNLQGINAITKNVHSRAIAKSPGTMVEPSKLTAIVVTPLRKRVKRDTNATEAAGKCGGNLQGINAITKDEINRLLRSKGWNMVIEARINGNNMGQ